LVYYRRPTTVEIEIEVWDDYLGHRATLTDRSLNLVIFDHPAMPLPTVDVRAFWRKSMATGSGIEALAAVTSGFVGLTSAAITNLLEHMIDPAMELRARVFVKPKPAIAWLASFGLGADAVADVSAQLEALAELP
jgi:hypothetical protein